MIKSRYEFSKSEYEAASVLAKGLDLPQAVALLLLRQGVRTKDQAQMFFSPRFSDLHDPFLMKNMREAKEQIEGSCKKQ